MSTVNRQVPKNSRYLSTSTEMVAVYNAITPARYDFSGTAACQNVVVTEIQPGTLYLLDTVSVGGNVSQEDYLGSIDVFPQLTIKNSIRNEQLYRYPIAVVQYYDGLGASVWFKSDNGNARLTLSLSGQCIQLPSMVGVLELKLMFSLSIWAIDDRYFNEAYNAPTCKKIASQLRGG